MSLGVLGVRPARRAIGALGATEPPKPWCWKAAGYPWGAAFDQCHAQMYQFCVSQKRYPGTVDGDKCVWDADRERCMAPSGPCPSSPPSTAAPGRPAAPSAGAGLVMGNKTSDPRVVELQKEINLTLSRNGYAAIGTDGKLGPGTCGAAREADKFGAGVMAKYGLTTVCTSFTAPVRSGGGGGFSPGTAPLAPPPDTLQSGTVLGMDTKTVLLVAGVGALAYVMFGKKKPKAA